MWDQRARAMPVLPMTGLGRMPWPMAMSSIDTSTSIAIDIGRLKFHGASYSRTETRVHDNE